MPRMYAMTKNIETKNIETSKSFKILERLIDMIPRYGLLWQSKHGRASTDSMTSLPPKAHL